MEIHTLVYDIYQLMQRKDNWFTEELAESFSKNMALRLQQQLGVERDPPRLRLSAMGPQCPKALWYSIHHPELAEPLPPWAIIKYSYGHITEALGLMLAKAAGHEVTGEQDAIELDGIVGHRDCVIDGVTVDIKSASSLAFNKFKSKSFEQSDLFGYLDQLDGYVVGSLHDPLVRVKDKGYIFALDKQLGQLCLYEHNIREDSIRQRIEYYKRIVGGSLPPACECETRAEGKSGNIILGTRASYGAYKYCCFPLLRAFRYSSGPVFFSKVERVPDVPEIFRKRVDISKVQQS